MSILRNIQNLFISKPNLENLNVIENLKTKHDVDGLVEALNFRSGDHNLGRKYKVTGVIATALADLGDISAITPLEKMLSDMDSKISFWEDMKVSLPYAFQLAETQVDYKNDMDAINNSRPMVIQALKALELAKHGVESDTNKQKLLRAVALLWELRAKRKNETTAQADPSFWDFLDESHLEMELHQGLTTLNDDERAKVQAVLN